MSTTPSQLSGARRIVARRLLAPAMLALLALILVLFYRHPWNRPSLTIAVARFDNESGDPRLDPFTNGLGDSVAADLTTLGGGRYAVIGDAAILRIPLGQRDLNAIANTLKANFVVVGQMERNGSHIRAGARLVHFPDQKVIIVTQVDQVSTDPMHDLAAMAQHIAADLNRRLGPLPVSGAN